jgi:hypothetical protein
MNSIYVAHEGMDTFFDCADTGYIFSSEEIQKDPELMEDLDNGYCRSSCSQVGYEITPGLAQMFYELAKSYWDFENSKG